MSGLPNYYRFQLKNTTAGTSSATASTVKMRRVKPATDGSADYEGSEQSALSGGSIASGGYANGSGYDNDVSAGYLGADLFITVVNGTSAGYYELRMQASTDGGTTWPDNGKGEAVWVGYVGASATLKDSVRVR